MKVDTLFDKISYPIYYFLKYMILVYGICIILALIIALVFYIAKGSPFTQTHLNALEILGAALMIIGALLLIASAGTSAPRSTGGGIYGQELRHAELIREWKGDLVSRVGQGLFLFIYGLILEFIVYAVS